MFLIDKIFLFSVPPQKTTTSFSLSSEGKNNNNLPPPSLTTWKEIKESEEWTLERKGIEWRWGIKTTTTTTKTERKRQC